MDLRRRLLGMLGLLLGGLMTMALLIQLHSLRRDIDTEVAASTRLVTTLLAAAGEADTAPDGEGLRHIHLRIAPRPADDAPPPLLVKWLGLAAAEHPEEAIRIGERTFYIAPNPRSEIEERLGDTVRLFITLLLYSGATLLAVWWSADRALRPVRALEDGLNRLARGERDPALPRFALHEFRRVAGAIDHLAVALSESRAARSAMARQLIDAREEERRALARDLHDDMGQNLTALNATAAHLERNARRLDAAAVAECAADLRRDLRTSGEQLRRMLKALRPHGLDAGGLSVALRELIDGWQSRGTGIEFALEQSAPLAGVNESVALTLYRIVQEALTNVVRHSAAHHCSVRITGNEQEVSLSIEDDGKGLPDAGLVERGGLLGMAERVEMAGGRLTLTGSPQGGLGITVLLPLKIREIQAMTGEAT